MMIARQACRILHTFSKMGRPVSQHQDLFHLMRDKSHIIDGLNAINKFNTTPLQPLHKILSQSMHMPQTLAKSVAEIRLQVTGFSPATNRQYKMHQKLNGELVLSDPSEPIPPPYDPYNNNLRLHWSINESQPEIEQYSIDRQTAYIFNLPIETNEAELFDLLGQDKVKSVSVKKCLMGLPAYAVVKFKSEGANYGKIKYQGHLLELVTYQDEAKLALSRRQIVLQGLEENLTPSAVFQMLSVSGRILHLDFPVEVYTGPSLKEVKQLYKNEKSPVKINFYKSNGTIESEYYPRFNPSDYQPNVLKQKEDEHRQKLKFCQNIDVKENEIGQVVFKNRGFCVVTYSCQEQVQNCYINNRFQYKMHLKNGQQLFQFDEKQRKALLRHIDNSYIRHCMDKNINLQAAQKSKVEDSLYFQSLFMKSIYEYDYKQMYRTLPNFGINNKSNDTIKIHFLYKNYLNDLKDTIGKDNIDPFSERAPNQYGKSFDELAEQELFGMKLKEKSSNPRYEVNIDDYIREPNKAPQFASKNKTKKIIKDSGEQQFSEEQLAKKEDKDSSLDLIEEGPVIPVTERQRKFEAVQAARAEEEAKAAAKEASGEKEAAKPAKPAQKGKAKFSTSKTPIQSNESYEKSIHAHMRYNKFIRDCINDYMGVFSLKKLEEEFRKEKPTFTNPQLLKFEDGTPIIREEEVERVMSFTKGQNRYHHFARDNEIAKSTNFNVEEVFLKYMDEWKGHAEYLMTDYGVVEETFQYNNQAPIQQFVQSLNNESEIGEQFKILQTKDGKQQIAKIKKMENAFPIDVIQKIRNNLIEKQKNNTLNIDEKALEILNQHYDFLWNGKTVPKQLAELLNIDPNTSVDAEKLSEDLCAEFGLRKKDLEKLLNVQHLSEGQIAEDIFRQKRISQARHKDAQRKASDYARDTSQIHVKNRQGKSVVSKFRQM